jgi:UTP--glucose-1-phosphate uridylyltransferase
MADHLELFRQRMREAGLSEGVIKTFSVYYRQLVEGATGKLGRDSIDPPEPERIIDFATLPTGNPDDLRRLVVVKLNGGLGTSMGLSKAKSLLPVKNGLTFLDIITRQTLLLRKKAPVPLLFMDSFNTREDTLAYLAKYPELKLPELPLDFVQNKFPKVRRDDFAPLLLTDDSANWNPPGHGDIYLTLADSGILDSLLNSGYEYMFVANADNLGAVVDDRILSYFARMKLPFMMEVCQRTASDRKGGHLAQTKTGRLVLRESAQCPESEVAEFQDIEQYRYFNTNNLWINLKSLKALLSETEGTMTLPLILNPKEAGGVPVYQIETAMGAAISVFEGSGALLVPRSRFAPVKKTDDLLSIWSDAYCLTDDWRIELHSDLSVPPSVTLDERYFKNIDQLLDRCSKGIPSLLRCNSLNLIGDIRFGQGVEFEGSTTVQADIPVVLENEVLIGEVRIP